MATPYMAMDLPVPGTTAGGAGALYLWAEKLNTALEDVVDGHDHSSGKGTRVPTSGININADLEFNGYDATELRSTRFEQQSSVAASDDIACLYVLSSTGDLYYRNAGGTQIRLTSGGAVNAAGLSANTYNGINKVADYTILPGDTETHFRFDTTAATRTATLPAASGVSDGRFYLLASSTGANSLVVAPAGADTINGSASSITVRGYGGAYVVRTGTTSWLAYEVGGILNGATVPEAGSLTTGNVLQVSGSAALSYAALNLAGGSNYVTGVLPAANLASATTGAQGAVVLAQDLSGTSSAPTVVAVTGASSKLVVRSTAPAIEWAEVTASPVLRQATNTTTTGQNLTIAAQSSSNAGSAGGDLLLSSGAPGAAGNNGKVKIQVGGSAGLYLKPSAGVSLTSVASLWADAGSSEIPDGARLLYLADGTMPSAATTGGCVIGSVSGDFSVMTAAGHILRTRKIASTVTSASAAGGTVSLPGVSGTTVTPAKVLIMTIDGTDYAIPMWTMSSYT